MLLIGGSGLIAGVQSRPGLVSVDRFSALRVATRRRTFQADMAKLNIKYLPLEPSTQELLSYSLNGLTALTAWARVEAGVHYPADVLSGWAVGYFIAQLANTFIAPQENIIITPMAMSRGMGFQVVILY